MVIEEDIRYTQEYLESDKRSIANAIQIFFKDGTSTDKIEVEYPIGHRRRREQGIPLLVEKFERNLATQFSEERCQNILNLCMDQNNLETTCSRNNIYLLEKKRVVLVHKGFLY